MTQHRFSNRFRRTTVSVVGLLFVFGVGVTSYGDDRFEGNWVGDVEVVESGRGRVRIVVTGSTATSFYCIDGEWSDGGSGSSPFTVRRNNGLFFWTSSGGRWSETQVFGLSYINDTLMSFVWVRQVNNETDDGDYDTWHALGQGKLRRESLDTNDC